LAVVQAAAVQRQFSQSGKEFGSAPAAVAAVVGEPEEGMVKVAQPAPQAQSEELGVVQTIQEVMVRQSILLILSLVELVAKQ
jgi:hypothetical protein